MRVITRDLPENYFTERKDEWRKIKYLCAVDRHDNEIMVIFAGSSELHRELHERMGFKRVLSAGYITYLEEQGFVCYGESMSLSTRARPEDTEILTAWIAERADPPQ